MADYKILLGIDLADGDLNTIKTKIKSLEDNPIKLKIDDSAVDTRIKNIKQELDSIGKTDGLKLNTSALESALTDVKGDITEIKNLLSSLGNGTNTKGLVSSINQISIALDKASAKFDALQADLSALSKKDFNFNIGFNMGGSNPIARNALYGGKVRGETVPQLQKQVAALEGYLQQYYKVADGINAVSKLIQGTNVATGLNHPLTLLPQMADDSNLSKQMTAYKQYIALIKEAASVKGVDLSSVTSGFSKSADELVSDAQKIQTGTQEMEDSFTKLKQIFGGGNNLNIEGISTQLTSIVTDLGEIKTAIQSLSSGASLDGLTQSFNRLSETLDKVIANASNLKGALGNGTFGTGMGTGVSGVAQELKEADIQIKATEDQIKNLRLALGNIGFNSSAIDSITKDFENLGITVKNVTSKLQSDGSVVLTVKGLDQYERAVTVMKSVGEDGITNLGTSISQSFTETENAFKRLTTLAKEMSSLELKIAGLDADKNSAEITELTSQLDKLKTEYNELYAITGKNLDSGQVDALNQKFAETANRVEAVKAKMADTSSVQKQAQAYKELLSVSKEMSSLELKIAGLKGQGGNANQVAELENQLKTLQATYQRLVQTMDTPLTGEQWSKIYTDIAQTKDKLAELDAKVLDTKTKLADGLSSSASISKVEGQYSKARASLDGLASVSMEVKLSFDNLTATYNNLTSAQQNYNSVMSQSASTDEEKIQAANRLINANKEYTNSLATTNNLIAENKRIEQQSYNTAALDQAKQNLSLKMSDWLKENSAAARQFGAEIQNLQVQLSQCNNKADVGLISKSFDNVTLKAKAAGVATKTWGDQIKAQFSKYGAYFSVASMFMYAYQGLRNMFEQVKAIDTAMTELKKVTDETDASYSQFLTNAASRAKEIGTTIDGLVTSTADFARLGYGFKDAQGLAEVANIYTVVGDEINGVEDATKSLISTMAAFKDEASDLSDADFALSIVDKFNEVSNNFAISSGGIGEALQRSASSLKAANNTIDESIALITAANTVVNFVPRCYGNIAA